MVQNLEGMGFTVVTLYFIYLIYVYFPLIETHY
jgi:hypothetical protein